MSKLYLRLLVLTAAITVLISISGNTYNTAQAAASCDPYKCQKYCESQGYPFGGCGSITRACVCWDYHPRP